MVQPSNSNLEGPGAIVINPDYTRQAVRVEVHFTTVHLEPMELSQTLYKLFLTGKQVFGVDWAMASFTLLGTIPVDKAELSIPTGDQVEAMGEGNA